MILEEYVESDYDASHLRLVCEDWRERIDRLLARFVEIQELAGIEMPRGEAQRAWLVRSSRRPTLQLSYTPLRITAMNNETGEIASMENVFLYMKPRYLRRTIRIIALGLPYMDHNLLYTPSLDFAGAFAYVDRVIYSIAPMLDRDEDEYFDALPCRPADPAYRNAVPESWSRTYPKHLHAPPCTRPHTRKLVVNDTAADWESTVQLVCTAPVKEIVIIMHPWPMPIKWSIGGAFDPRQCIVALVVRGLHIGANVTIVNPTHTTIPSSPDPGVSPYQKRTVDSEEASKKSSEEASEDEWDSDSTDDDEAEQTLRDLIDHSLASLPAPRGGLTHDLHRQLRIITTREYVAEIGWPEFEIEACLRWPTVSPTAILD